jgi:hypothetical protein
VLRLNVGTRWYWLLVDSCWLDSTAEKANRKKKENQRKRVEKTDKKENGQRVDPPNRKMGMV